MSAQPVDVLAVTIDRAQALLNVARCAKALAKAQQDSDKAAASRAALGTDCTRARMTSANARWMTCAEERDRKDTEFRAALLLIGVEA